MQLVHLRDARPDPITTHAQRTSNDGQDGLMDCLYFPGVQEVAREQSYYEEDDEDGQGPGREYLLLASFWLLCIGALDSGREVGGGPGLTIGVCVDNISLCGKGTSQRRLLSSGPACAVDAGCVLSIWPMAHHPITEAMMGSPLQYHQQAASQMCAQR